MLSLSPLVKPIKASWSPTSKQTDNWVGVGAVRSDWTVAVRAVWWKREDVSAGVEAGTFAAHTVGCLCVHTIDEIKFTEQEQIFSLL